MITALEQKKFIDWFVDYIFEENDELPEVYLKESPRLKERLRTLCYRGLREAVSDFFTQNHLMQPSDLVEHYDFFKYHNTIEQRVKTTLMKDTVLGEYLGASVLSPEGNCENIAILAEIHYLDRLRAFAGLPEEQVWE